MTVAATLNDLRATKARATLPAWGRWYADASLDGEHTLTGRVTLKMADLTLSGTILSGGPAKGRSFYRIVAGAGSWGRTIKRKDYSTDFGVRMANVLADAASEVGETLGPIDRSISVGAAWVREEGPAARQLELLAPGGWYVGEDGVTRIGARPPSKLPAGVTHGDVDLAAASVTLASDSIAGILPGLVVDGLTAVDVVHELNAKSGLRSTIYGSLAGGSSRSMTALRKVFEQLDPNRKFRGFTEYRVVETEGKRLNLQPVLVSMGMPDLTRVPIRPGVAGVEFGVADGAIVVVGFANASPSKAFVAHFEDVDGDGFASTSLTLSSGNETDLTGGHGRVVRYGDPIVFASPGPGTIEAGAVLTHFSKVKS